MSAATMDLPESYLTADRGPGLRAFIIVMVIITILSILLRLMSRGLSPMQPGHKQSQFWLDDWSALIAVPFILAQHVLALVALDRGFGRHAAVLGVPTVLWIARIAWIAYFVYDAGLFLTKLSVLLFLRRVFPKSHSGHWFNIGLLVAHVINVAWLLGIVFGTIFLCDPIEKSYNPMIPGSCGSTSSLYIGSAVPSIAIDLIILILPLPKLWSLQIDRARKIGLIVIFTFGYCVIVMSLGRLITTLKTQEDLNTDFSYAAISFMYWVSAEPTFSLMGICLPAMLPLGRYLMITYFSPLASKVSSVLSRRGSGDDTFNSKNGDLSISGEHDDRQLQRGETKKNMSATHVGWNPDIHGTGSLDSQREILGSSRQQDHYTVDVSGGETWSGGDSSGVPLRTIRVDNDVRVS